MEKDKNKKYTFEKPCQALQNIQKIAEACTKDQLKMYYIISTIMLTQLSAISSFLLTYNLEKDIKEGIERINETLSSYTQLIAKLHLITKNDQDEILKETLSIAYKTVFKAVEELNKE